MLSQGELIYLMDIIEELAALADPSEYLEDEVQQALDLLENAETLGLQTYLDLNKELEEMENQVEVKSMSDEEVLAFAEKILETIDKDGVISAEGKALLEDKANLPSEEDQIRIMQIVKERVQNGEQDSTTEEKASEEGTAAVESASEAPAAEAVVEEAQSTEEA